MRNVVVNTTPLYHSCTNFVPILYQMAVQDRRLVKVYGILKTAKHKEIRAFDEKYIFLIRDISTVPTMKSLDK